MQRQDSKLSGFFVAKRLFLKNLVFFMQNRRGKMHICRHLSEGEKDGDRIIKPFHKLVL